METIPVTSAWLGNPVFDDGDEDEDELTEKIQETDISDSNETPVSSSSSSSTTTTTSTQRADNEKKQELDPCPICQEYPKKAMLCSGIKNGGNCTGMFCYGCLLKIKAAGRLNRDLIKCPYCDTRFKEVGDLYRYNRPAQNAYDKLIVKCTSDDCDFETEHESILKHIQKCTFTDSAQKEDAKYYLDAAEAYEKEERERIASYNNNNGNGRGRGSRGRGSRGRGSSSRSSSQDAGFSDRITRPTPNQTDEGSVPPRGRGRGRGAETGGRGGRGSGQNNFAGSGRGRGGGRGGAINYQDNRWESYISDQELVNLLRHRSNLATNKATLQNYQSMMNTMMAGDPTYTSNVADAPQDQAEVLPMPTCDVMRTKTKLFLTSLQLNVTYAADVSNLTPAQREARERKENTRRQAMQQIEEIKGIMEETKRSIQEIEEIGRANMAAADGTPQVIPTTASRGRAQTGRGGAGGRDDQARVDNGTIPDPGDSEPEDGEDLDSDESMSDEEEANESDNDFIATEGDVTPPQETSALVSLMTNPNADSDESSSDDEDFSP